MRLARSHFYCRASSPLAADALALDFRTPQYWSAGARSASLPAMPGYAFTDSVDNLPNIDSSGFHSVVAEASNLRVGTALPNGAWILWSVIDLAALPASGFWTPFAVSIAGAGTDVIYTEFDPSGNLLSAAAVGGVGVTIPQIATAIAVGRNVVMLAYQGGKYSLAVKGAGGGVTIGADSAAAAALLADRINVGTAFNGSQTMNGTTEGLFQRNGSFDGAARSAILAAA